MHCSAALWAPSLSVPGIEGVNFGAVLAKVLIPALVSPIVAGLAAFVAVKLIYFIVKKMSEDQIVNGFRHGQTVTACLVALFTVRTMRRKPWALSRWLLSPLARRVQALVPSCGLWPCAVWRLQRVRTWAVGASFVLLARALPRFPLRRASPPRLLPQPRFSFLLTWASRFLPRRCAPAPSSVPVLATWQQGELGRCGSYACRMARYFPGCRSCGRCGVRTAKTGLGGTIAVAFIAVVAALVIFRLSKRNPVNSGNVNEASEVKNQAFRFDQSRDRCLRKDAKMQEFINFATVLVVAVCVAGMISTLYASGLRLWAAGGLDREGYARIMPRVGSVVCFAGCVFIVLFALWLMIPIFH